MRTARNQISPLEFYFDLTPKEAKIVSLINDGKLTINDITNKLGYCYSSAIQMIRELKSAGIVSLSRAGQHYYYSISNPLVHALLT